MNREPDGYPPWVIAFNDRWVNARDRLFHRAISPKTSAICLRTSAAKGCLRVPDPLSVIIHVDGAARGNPGPAAYGYVIRAEGFPDLCGNGVIGQATNNVAEYTGLIKALTKALELGATQAHVRSDSELMVRQMRGEYRVKNEGLQPLYQQAQELVRQLGDVTFEHVYREDNTEADRLCNEALAGQLVEPADWERKSCAAANPTRRRAKKASAPAAPSVSTTSGPLLEGQLTAQGRLVRRADSGFELHVLGFTFPIEFVELGRMAQAEMAPEAAAAAGLLVRLAGEVRTIGGNEDITKSVRFFVREFEVLGQPETQVRAR